VTNVDFYSKNKFEKLVHPIGFIIRIFHDARSSECQKGKAVPLQAWSGSEGSRKLRFPDYMTTAQDGGKVVTLTHRPPLPPGNARGTHFC
jgi:hypothetical protein